jgi:hypothetical protein
MALGTLGFILTKDQRFEFVLTFFANVLKNGHDPASDLPNRATYI